MNKGLLITFEGIDGSGKTTLIKNISNELQIQNIPFITTKEPGGTPLGMHLRHVLQNQPVPVCPKAEYLLFAADRAQHFEEKIIPALQKGLIVISDRMSDSSVVYQGYARGLDKETIMYINQWAMQKREADITFYVRISAQESQQRIHGRNIPLTVFEKERSDFTQTLIEGFDHLFKNKSHVILLNGTDSPENLTTQVLSHIQLWITKNNTYKP